MQATLSDDNLLAEVARQWIIPESPCGIRRICAYVKEVRLWGRSSQ